MPAQVVPHDQLKSLPPYCGKVEIAVKQVGATIPDLPCFRPDWKPVVLPPATPYENLKLSSDNYSYVLSQDEKGTTIVLSEASSGKSKTFFLAGEHTLWVLLNHMHSLTDELCEQWFKERDHGKKKKKKDS